MLKLTIILLCAYLSACSIFHDDYAGQPPGKSIQDLYPEGCGL